MLNFEGMSLWSKGIVSSCTMAWAINLYQQLDYRVNVACTPYILHKNIAVTSVNPGQVWATTGRWPAFSPAGPYPFARISLPELTVYKAPGKSIVRLLPLDKR